MQDSAPAASAHHMKSSTGPRCPKFGDGACWPGWWHTEWRRLTPTPALPQALDLRLSRRRIDGHRPATSISSTKPSVTRSSHRPPASRQQPSLALWQGPKACPAASRYNASPNPRTQWVMLPGRDTPTLSLLSLQRLPDPVPVGQAHLGQLIRRHIRPEVAVILLNDAHVTDVPMLSAKML